MYILKNYLGNRYEFNFKIFEKYSNYNSNRLKVAIYDFKINEEYQDDTFAYINIVDKEEFYMLEIEIFDFYQNLIVDLKLNEYRERFEEEMAIFNNNLEIKSKSSIKKDIENNVQVEIIDDPDFGYSLIGVNIFNPFYIDLANELDKKSEIIKNKKLINKKIGLNDLLSFLKN
ncbi:hypothetical protein [Clostridium thermobutyricum]|uniref:hypothetical protein n=1 Tax=Clostridium thermobutyricum TaxID=29372 RepID=UPI0018A96294|nr:hypothetical protein [Clostridium thermobutyricum]